MHIEITGREQVALHKESLAIKVSSDSGAAVEPLQTWNFGNERDGVIEMAAGTHDGGIVEIGFYYGVTKPKPIIKISPQIGCPARCNFCELGGVAFKRNLTPVEMVEQVRIMRETAIQLGALTAEAPIKVNFAGSGEPLFNKGLVETLALLGDELHPSFKVSTVFPNSKKCQA